MNPTAPASLVGAWPTASPFWRSRLHRYPSQNGGVREGVDPKPLVEAKALGWVVMGRSRLSLQVAAALPRVCSVTR
jgi:hypothetical protein